MLYWVIVWIVVIVEQFQVWPEIVRKSKEGGLDVIETYVFWNNHEPVRGEVLKEATLSLDIEFIVRKFS